MRNGKETLTYRILDTSFDSNSSSGDDHYDLPSPTFKWKEPETKRLIWSSRRSRYRPARLLLPSIGALILLYWIYSNSNQIDRLSAIATAQANLNRIRENAYFYHHNMGHKHLADNSDTISSLASSLAFPSSEESTPGEEHEAARIVVPAFREIPKLEDEIRVKPTKPEDIEISKMIDLVMEEHTSTSRERIIAAATTTPIPIATFSKVNVVSSTTTPPLEPSSHAHLPTYEEVLAGPKSIWTYQDDYTADHASCAAMRSKLKSKTSPSTTERKATHRAPSIGQVDFFGGSTCSTYEDRFGPYTDRSLDLTYRKIDDVIPTDWLLGPQKPLMMRNHQWTFYLQHRHREMNSKAIGKVRKEIPDWKALVNRCGLDQEADVPLPKKRTIILHRFYEGFVMTEDKILDLRAMLTEMVINRPYDGWDIRILVELKETPGAFVSRILQREVLKSMMPIEFWGLVEFWSEDREKSIMPGLNGPLDYGFSISCLLPSQLYSFLHPEYDFIYNWEADLRFLGNYENLFDTVEDYGRNESMNLGMQKYSRWLIPDAKASQRHWYQYSEEKRGKGKEPDMITFNAILDVEGSDWTHSSKHALDYGSHVPLRTSIVSLLRMSRNLIKAMTLATVEKEKAMQCEAWPSTAVLHSQLPPSSELTFDEELAQELKDIFPLKGVFVPHPVYIEDEIDGEEIDYQINRRRYFRNEKFMGKSTFNWQADYPGDIYNRWRRNQGQDGCRMPALMHPIKNVGYNLKEKKIDLDLL